MRKISPVSIITLVLIAAAILTVWLFSRKSQLSESQKETWLQEGDKVALTKRLAESYLKDEKYDLAVEYYIQAIRLRPGDAHIHNDLGSTYHYMGKADAVASQNEDARGSSTSEVLQKTAAALNLIDSGIIRITVDGKNQADKVVSYAVSLQGIAYISPEKSKHLVTIVTGKTKEAFLKAESEYRKAIQIKARYAPAYRNLGTLYYEMGRPKEAIDFWRMALKLDPSDKALKSYLQEMGIQ